MAKKSGMAFIAKVGYAKLMDYKGRSYTSLRVTIPSHVVKALGLARGDYVKVAVEKVEVRPAFLKYEEKQ